MTTQRELVTETRYVSDRYAGGAGMRENWENCCSVAEIRKACRIVLLITREMANVAGDNIASGRERRRTISHFRQIAMYVCHVTLQLSLSEIGQAFGRDRTTVAYSCRVIEDRRDEPGFDEFVATVERLALSVVIAAGVHDDV